MEGSSCRANFRLSKRPQAAVVVVEKEPKIDQDHTQGLRGWRLRHTSRFYAFITTVASTKKLPRRVKGAEDLSDALHVALDLLVITCVWSACGPPPEVAFDPAHNPGIVWYGKQEGPR